MRLLAVAPLLALALAVTPVSAQQPPPRSYGVLHGFLDECRWYSGVGDSMAPALQDGDLVCVAKFNFNVVTYGDLVLYRTGGACRFAYEDRLFLHRVVWIGQGEDGKRVLRLRGDAETEWDLCEVTEADYVGMVTGVTRR